MVKYYLLENHLTDRTDDFMAHAQSAGAYSKEELIDRMLQRGSTLTRIDILAVLANLEETIIDILQEGSTVSTSLFRISFSMSGVFNGPMDSYEQGRHQFHINISPGTSLRNAQNTIKLVKTDTVTPSFNILEVKDSVSGKINEVLTPNGVLEVYGSHCKVFGSNPKCGLYFVDSAGEETKAVTFVQNKPSTVIVMIPALAAGVYQVKIATQYNGTTELKNVRDFSFNHDLTVS